MTAPDSELVLILAPRGRDAPIATKVLRDAGIVALACSNLDHLCREIRATAGAVLVTTEALPAAGVKQLLEALEEQPSWSELPLLIFAAPGLDRPLPSFKPLAARSHITLLDRPIRVKTLISATLSALHARRRQYQLRGLMEELEGRVHERDKFLAILGHELRNPLAAILLASQRAQAGESGLDEEHAALIERQARHVTRLVEDLLDLSRVIAGKILLQRVLVDLKQVVAEALEIVRDAAAEQRVKLHFAADVGPILVEGDPVRLEQIVSNLLTNAVKYTPAGGRVDVRVERNGSALLRIEDTGVGIDPARLTSIFGLFAQAENAIGRSQGGMGIGLSLVRNLVELHAGTVTARSAGVGQGSEFVVSLPLAAAAARAEPPPPAAPIEAQAPLSIVLIEDNADVRTLLQRKLSKLGHTVDGVGQGEDGIARIVESPPDLALIDIGLPDIDGHEVARRVRAAIGGRVRLVALSGFGQPEDRQRALDAGFDEHLAKPADMKDLEGLLARARHGAGAP